MSIEQRLIELGLQLPPVPRPIGNYVAGVITGSLLFMSGIGPRRHEGGYIAGRLGQDLDVDQGYAAARLVGLNMLSNIRSVLGSLDRIDRVVKVLGMVNCTPEFSEQPKVINGFSDLMVVAFGDGGKAARSAVGMQSLPSDIAVEIEATVELRSD